MYLIQKAHVSLEEKKRCAGMTHEELRGFCEKHHSEVFGEFAEYFEGKKSLAVPVYTIWGDEDYSVVEELLAVQRASDEPMKTRVQNLFVVGPEHAFDFEGFTVFGLGGEVSMNTLFHKGHGRSPLLPGNEGRIWITMHQLNKLARTIEEHPVTPGKSRVLLVNDGPLRHPILLKIGHFCKADYIVNAGHGHVQASLFNEGRVRNMKQHLQMMKGAQHDFEQAIKRHLESPDSQVSPVHFDDAVKILSCIPQSETDLSRLWLFSLCRAENGFAFLEMKSNLVGLQIILAPQRHIREEEDPIAERLAYRQPATTQNTYTVRVGPLSHSTSEDDVRLLFSANGISFSGVSLLNDGLSGEPTGDALVIFEDEAAMKGALELAEPKIAGSVVKIKPRRAFGERKPMRFRGKSAAKTAEAVVGGACEDAVQS